MQPIFVGDIQGCADELDEILERAARSWGRRFELWVVGDAVNRGPANLRVLRALRELDAQGRAHYVLGNHEIALLEAALGLRQPSRTDTFVDVLEAPDGDDWIDWLRTRPLVETGMLGEQPFAMVHAAAHPDWDLDALSQQGARIARELAAGRKAARALLGAEPSDPRRDVLERLTTCRSVTRGRWSEEPPARAFVAWHAAWSQRSHGYGVVYGHWSLQGLHVAQRLRGLDTGCVHHGRSGSRSLTAWIPDPRSAQPFDIPDRSFWHVPARRAYYDASKRAAARDVSDSDQTVDVFR